MDYKKFNKYYSHRAKILGKQNGANTLPFNFIRRQVKKGLRIVDVGCGRGMYLIPLSDSGEDILGLDYNESNVNLLQANNYKVTQCDCLIEIPFEKTFDVALCCEMLEHFKKEQALNILSNIWKALKKNGKLIVSVPFKEDFAKNMDVCPNCECLFHRHGHLQTFNSLSELTDLVEARGFEYLDHLIAFEKYRLSKVPYWIGKTIVMLGYEGKGDLLAVFKKKDV